MTGGAACGHGIVQRVAGIDIEEIVGQRLFAVEVEANPPRERALWKWRGRVRV